MNKVDFAVIFSVEKANPNGDPINGNTPRQDLDGYGEVSDVCIKRKIRNRLQEMGEEILMKENTWKKTDPYRSVAARVDADEELAKLESAGDIEGFATRACKKWIDVRAFGQVFAYTGKKNVSIGVRGPVSIQYARSVQPIIVREIGITKSLNSSAESNKKDSSTMGHRYIVDKASYVFCGSIFPQLAELTGFTDEDKDKIKKCLLRLFDNDGSVARPSGSMIIQEVYWWEHNCRSGQYPSGKVHHSLKIEPSEEYPYYKATLEDLDGLVPEIYGGW